MHLVHCMALGNGSPLAPALEIKVPFVCMATNVNECTRERGPALQPGQPRMAGSVPHPQASWGVSSDAGAPGEGQGPWPINQLQGVMWGPHGRQGLSPPCSSLRPWRRPPPPPASALPQPGLQSTEGRGVKAGPESGMILLLPSPASQAVTTLPAGSDRAGPTHSTPSPPVGAGWLPNTKHPGKGKNLDHTAVPQACCKSHLSACYQGPGIVNPGGALRPSPWGGNAG